MTTLYKTTKNSQYLNNNFVNKNAYLNAYLIKNSIYNLNSQVNNNKFVELLYWGGEMFFEKLLLKIKKPRYYVFSKKTNNEVRYISHAK